MKIEVAVESGFMDTPIPVIKFNDGTVKFWLPWVDWLEARKVLSGAIEDFPDYMAKLDS